MPTRTLSSQAPLNRPDPKQARKRGMTYRLPRPDFSYADSLQSVFSGARKGLLTLLELVRAADGIDGLLEIHQRHRVIGMLKIRIHIIRRSTGGTFDVRKIDDGFVKLQYHWREQRNNPTIVIAGITAR